MMGARNAVIVGLVAKLVLGGPAHAGIEVRSICEQVPNQASAVVETDGKNGRVGDYVTGYFSKGGLEGLRVDRPYNDSHLGIDILPGEYKNPVDSEVVDKVKEFLRQRIELYRRLCENIPIS